MNNRQMLKPSSLTPLIYRDVMRDLRGLDRTNVNQGIAFEKYIEELFINIGWSVYLTPNSGDYGVDLIAESPSGFLVFIQSKDYDSILNAEPVQEVLSGFHFYIHEADLKGKIVKQRIVIASGHGKEDRLEYLYNGSARELAKRSKVVLWTPKELQILANTAIDGQHLLEQLGMDLKPKIIEPHLIQIPISIEPPLFSTTLTPAKPKENGFPLIATVVGLCFLVGAYLLLPSSARAGIKKTLDPEGYKKTEAQRIVNFVSFWNQTYQQALKNNNLEIILPYVVGEQKTGVTALFETRRQRGCILTIQERNPYQSTPITFTTLDTAKTAIFRDAAYVENCSDGSQRLLRNGTQVKVTYDLEKINGNWRITESITSGGVIK
jgi:hypothetical protein